MRSVLDFSSWQVLLPTLIGLVLVSVIAVGVRLLVMQTMQERRERENRQINERLKTLIAAYKTLGSSFTGQLTADPCHWRELRQVVPDAASGGSNSSSDRARRMRPCGSRLVRHHPAGHRRTGEAGRACRAGNGQWPAGRDRRSGRVTAPVHPRCAGTGADPGVAGDPETGPSSSGGQRRQRRRGISRIGRWRPRRQGRWGWRWWRRFGGGGLDGGHDEHGAHHDEQGGAH